MQDYVRITSGKFKGRKILTPGGKTHPMGERERLALFNMLGGDLSGQQVLDLYAGSGALGCEALSRNAEKVVFVEHNSTAAKCIRDNVKSLSLDMHCEIIKDKVANYNPETTFDIIVADPPYDDFKPDELADVSSWLKNGGVFILSHPGVAPEISGLNLIKTHQYAAAHLSVYHK